MSDCDLREAECYCDLEAGHDGPHVCGCGGSWAVVKGRFEIVEFPGANPTFPYGTPARPDARLRESLGRRTLPWC